MEKNGMIRKESVPVDARLKSLVPTQKAIELNSRVYEYLQDMDRLLTQGLTEEQVLQFKEMAAQMLKNLDEYREKTTA